MTCSATVCMFFMYNDQDQFLLPRNGPSNLILDCVAIWQFLAMNLSEYRTMQDWNWIALLHPCFVNQWCRLFFVQFYNFRAISNWSQLTLFVCLLFFLFIFCFLFLFFHFVYLVTNRFLLNILLISCSMQVSFIFNMYMQLIIAGLKTSLHLPFAYLN